jgi:hypothetical protein
LTVVVVFPQPPFWFTIAMTRIGIPSPDGASLIAWAIRHRR